MLASAIVLWGWNISGPALILRAKTEDKKAELYRLSLMSRIVVFGAVAPLACIVSACVAPAPAEAVAMTAAMTLGGLSPSWYSVATGRPQIAAVFEAVPRLIAMLVSIPLILAFRFVWIYPLVLSIAFLYSLFILSSKMRSVHEGSWCAGAIFKGLRNQARSAISIALGSVYGAVPVPISTVALNIQQASAFASVFQIYRFATFPILTLGNAFQSWVLGSEDRPVWRRQLTALLVHGSVGFIGALLFGAVGPLGSEFLFGATHRAPAELCWLFGAALLFLSLNTPLTRNLLIPAGCHRIFFWATVVSAFLGATVMFFSGLQGIQIGIAVGFALSEMMVFAVVVVPAFRIVRYPKPWHPEG
nr:hypothetical protein [Arthrobacter ulcerisalmonis]